VIVLGHPDEKAVFHATDRLATAQIAFLEKGFLVADAV